MSRLEKKKTLFTDIVKNFFLRLFMNQIHLSPCIPPSANSTFFLVNSKYSNESRQSDDNNASKCTVDYSGTLADFTPKNGINKYTVLSEQRAPKT